jgi:hypothetical protein
MDEPVDAIGFHEARNCAIPVLINSANEIVGDADIERSAGTTCENMHLVLTHGLEHA